MASAMIKPAGEIQNLIFSQNLKLTHLARCGRIDEAVKLFESMPSRNAVSWNCMISAFAKNGRVADARHLFDRMASKNLISWNTMIAGYSHNNRLLEASQLFDEMPRRDSYSWTLMISCFSRHGELERARRLFDSMPGVKTPVCYNAMIAGYAKNRRFEEAIVLLNEMPVSARNMVSWNSVLAGYTQNQEMVKVLNFFEEMPEKDVVSWNLMVEGFLQVGDLESALTLFRRTPCPNVASWVTMLNGFSKSGKIEEARRLFHQMPERNLVAWNAMISGHVQFLQIEEARRLFDEMPERNSVTWTTMINGYIRIRKLDKARELLNAMPFKNVAAQTAMLSGYLQCMRMEEAVELFEKISTRDDFCWNAMISGYAQCGRMDEAVDLYKKMPTKNVFSLNTIIAGHGQQGEMHKAMEVFKQMRERDTVTWNSIISGLTQNGFYFETLKHFALMRNEARKQDWCTYACGLTACAYLAALQMGKQLHLLLLRSGHFNDLFAANSLINMYARCGRISASKQVFDELVSVDLISWNTLIHGYALNGFGRETILVFKEMEANGFRPDEITFVGVLSACSHAGLIDEGLKYFDSMRKDHSVEPVAEHYACVVDLLGRAGRLEEAHKLVTQMAVKPNAGVWGALLGACRMHGNPDMASFAAEKLFEIEPRKTSNYVLLSNIHADGGRWEDVDRVRALMKEMGVQKQPGCSWIDIKNEVCCFVSDDSMKFRTAEVGFVLEMLCGHTRNTEIIYWSSFLDCG
ncbi:pentatricopeptide repeat-containing protein At4g02750-like [Phalaenopsis equestris]|uniref:pentatricopeptide repeat-containing protein At4g02750-like n=1 Tax=Phalaenopsis equestris TaxID=78828 RepID=UPI0009E3B0D2|nr:pentatricopeptide repeat-containing protein At4g02750-like [Phalaenopsis equestris]